MSRHGGALHDLVDPHGDVLRWALEARGVETPRMTRRKLRRIQRYGSGDDQDGAISLPFQGSRVDAIVASTTSTVNYQEAYTFTFQLPPGNWRLVVRPRMEVRLNNTGFSVDVRVLFDAIETLYADSPIEQVINGWMSPMRTCEPNDTIGEGSHTIRLDYKSGASGATAAARAPSVDVTATLEAA